MVSLSAVLAILATVVLYIFNARQDHLDSSQTNHTIRQKLAGIAAKLIVIVILGVSFVDIGGRVAGKSGLESMTIRLSSYKSLSYALQYPGARIIYQRWNAFSRVDVVRSQGSVHYKGLAIAISSRLHQKMA
jgi:hypothetical protein